MGPELAGAGGRARVESAGRAEEAHVDVQPHEADHQLPCRDQRKRREGGVGHGAQPRLNL